MNQFSQKESTALFDATQRVCEEDVYKRQVALNDWKQRISEGLNPLSCFPFFTTQKNHQNQGYNHVVISPVFLMLISWSWSDLKEGLDTLGKSINWGKGPDFAKEYPWLLDLGIHLPSLPFDGGPLVEKSFSDWGFRSWTMLKHLNKTSYINKTLSIWEVLGFRSHYFEDSSLNLPIKNHQSINSMVDVFSYFISAGVNFEGLPLSFSFALLKDPSHKEDRVCDTLLLFDKLMSRHPEIRSVIAPELNSILHHSKGLTLIENQTLKIKEIEEYAQKWSLELSLPNVSTSRHKIHL